MKLSNKKILVTGATGFIGANLTRYLLKEGANVAIFTRETSNKWRIKDILKEVLEYSVDLLNECKLKKLILNIKPEIIFHTATYGGFPFQRDIDKIIQTNIIGTMNLVNACSKTGFNAFVNTGSSSEYGIKFKPMNETDLLEPNSNYGIAKSAGTLFCQLKSKNENLPIVTLRLFSPYGYYEEKSRLIPYVILSCLKAENPKLSSPDSVRDFILVEDLIEAYMRVVDKIETVKGEIFNIGYGRQHSVKEVVNKIIELTGNSIKPEWRSVPNPRIEPKIWQADISKAKKLLNWQPKYNLIQGLKKTINWFRENKKLYE